MQKPNDSTVDIRGRVIEIIYQAIDELNQDSDSSPVGKSPETVLFGPSSAFDSLKLVNLIVAVEQKVEDEFGFAISAIANERAMSQKQSPLRNVGTLADFMTSILAERNR